MRNINPALAAVLVGTFLIGVSHTVTAHHSRAQYDNDKMVTYQGTVTDLNWSNPHVHFSIDGMKVGLKNGPTERLAIETAGPVSLGKIAWSRNTVKIGDKITVTGSPTKDGSPYLLLFSVTLASGTHLITRD